LNTVLAACVKNEKKSKKTKKKVKKTPKGLDVKEAFFHFFKKNLKGGSQ